MGRKWCLALLPQLLLPQHGYRLLLLLLLLLLLCSQQHLLLLLLLLLLYMHLLREDPIPHCRCRRSSCHWHREGHAPTAGRHCSL